MEVNILAYQDLLLTKDAELKILEAKLLNQENAGPDQSALLSEIEQLKQLLLDKQKHIEALERKFREFGYDKELAPREDTRLKAYKKVEHINIQIEKRLEEVHEYYRNEILKMSEKFLAEIQQLKDERKKYTSDSSSAVAVMRRECDLQIEELKQNVAFHKQLLKGKESENEAFAAKIRQQDQANYE